jgi:hypothetical protein
MRDIKIFFLLVVPLALFWSCKGPEKLMNVSSFYPYDNQVFTTNKVEVNFTVQEIRENLFVNVRVNGNLVYKKDLILTNNIVVELDKPTNIILVEFVDSNNDIVFSKEITVFYNKPETKGVEKRKVVVKPVRAKKPKYAEVAKKMEEVSRSSYQRLKRLEKVYIFLPLA